MRGGRLKLREAGQRLLLLTTALALPLVLVEAGVHAVEAVRGPIFPGGMLTQSFAMADPVLGFRHRPDFEQSFGWPEHPNGSVTIRTNNLGLREDEPTSAVPSDERRRVLVLGDSHTDGLVDNHESWPNVMERASAGAWDVLNAGVSGYQPWHYLEWWRAYGRDLLPDLVVVGYYLGNDLPAEADAKAPDVQALDPAEAADRARRSGPVRRVLRAIRHRCRLCALTSMVVHNTVLDGPTYEETMYLRGDDPDERRRYLAAIRHCIGCLWQSVEQSRNARATPDAYPLMISANERVLGELRDEVRATGAELAVVLIPTKLQIEPTVTDLAAETARLLGLAELRPLLEDAVAVDLMAALERLDVYAIDVRPALLTEYESTGRPLFYDADWHINVEGSNVIGTAVAEALAAPPSPSP